MGKLPSDVMANIFSRIPQESILDCKLVSKTWNTVITNRGLRTVIPSLDTSKVSFISLNMLENNTFQMLYLEYDEELSKMKILKINHPPIQRVHYTETMYGEGPFRKAKTVIIGSSNGLICLAVPNDGLYGTVNDPLYICNPVTREFVYIPIPTINENCTTVRNVFGFGYNDKTKEYKVIRVYYESEDVIEKGLVQVYTLGAGTGWRNKGYMIYSLQSNNSYSPGTNVDGFVYWLYQEKPKLGVCSPNSTEGRIIAFDLANETYRLSCRPPYFTTLCCFRRITGFLYHKTRILGGKLCEVHEFPNEFGYYSLNIWSYVKESDGWTLGSRMPLKEPFQSSLNVEFFDLTKNRELLCWDHKKNPLSYDWRSDTVKQLLTDAPAGLEVFETIRHQNSLVSLKELGEEGVQMFDRIK